MAFWRWTAPQVLQMAGTVRAGGRTGTLAGAAAPGTPVFGEVESATNEVFGGARVGLCTAACMLSQANSAGGTGVSTSDWSSMLRRKVPAKRRSRARAWVPFRGALERGTSELRKRGSQRGTIAYGVCPASVLVA